METNIIQNADVFGMAKRIDRMIYELFKAVSSASSELNDFDHERALQNLAHCQSYHDWVIGQPQMDLPESHPSDFELLGPPETQEVENDAVNDLIRLLKQQRYELVNSQSARKAAGLIGFDSKRTISSMDKCKSLLETAEVKEARDLPESSPRNVSSGSGRKGTKSSK